MKSNTQIFVSEGHLIDSGIMTKILNLIVAEEAEYQVLKFEMGKNNLAPSHLEIEVRCDGAEKLAMLTAKLVNLGCYEKITKEAVLKPEGVEARVWVSKERGRITGRAIADEIKDIGERTIMLCGPKPMMESLKKQFEELGVEPGNIVTEDFALYGDY